MSAPLPPRAARLAAGLGALAVGVAGCATAPGPAEAPSDGRSATVDLQPVRGTTARGEIRLVQEGRQVRVEARLAGLRPRWSYVLFLAERADCGGTEPGGARTVPLAGALRTLSAELPRLVSDADGNAAITLVVAGSLAARDGDLAGRAFVLQPDGYGRAACGGVPPG